MRHERSCHYTTDIKSPRAQEKPQHRGGHTLPALHALEHVDELLSAQLVVVLGSDLAHNLEVLAQVGGHHGLEALHGILHGQRAEVRHQPL